MQCTQKHRTITNTDAAHTNKKNTFDQQMCKCSTNTEKIFKVKHFDERGMLATNRTHARQTHKHIRTHAHLTVRFDAKHSTRRSDSTQLRSRQRSESLRIYVNLSVAVVAHRRIDGGRLENATVLVGWSAGWSDDSDASFAGAVFVLLRTDGNHTYSTQ